MRQPYQCSVVHTQATMFIIRIIFVIYFFTEFFCCTISTENAVLIHVSICNSILYQRFKLDFLIFRKELFVATFALFRVITSFILFDGAVSTQATIQSVIVNRK